VCTHQATLTCPGRRCLQTDVAGAISICSAGEAILERNVGRAVALRLPSFRVAIERMSELGHEYLPALEQLQRTVARRPSLAAAARRRYAAGVVRRAAAAAVVFERLRHALPDVKLVEPRLSH
jgi:hypothetical protein